MIITERKQKAERWIELFQTIQTIIVIEDFRERAISNLQTFIIIEEDQKNLALCYVVDEMLVKIKTHGIYCL